jgi:hypothetical protein
MTYAVYNGSQKLTEVETISEESASRIGLTKLQDCSVFSTVVDEKGNVTKIWSKVLARKGTFTVIDVSDSYYKQARKFLNGSLVYLNPFA